MWDLNQDLDSIRNEFPILARSVYLISNSLGAVPRQALEGLKKYYQLWAEEGVGAWEKEWWDLSRRVGNQVASLIGAGEDEVTMMTNATVSYWVALSTRFASNADNRSKIIMTDHDFPSILYAVSKIAQCMGWELEVLRSHGQPGIDVNDIAKKIDEKTLFVATSHVYFKSAYVQDISQIAARARQVGALTLIDGYHAPGTLPVDVKQLDVDFYIGGCLKWLCGGPGNAFLYVRPELASSLKPQLTGWFAHQNPFLFSQRMEYTQSSYRFMSGTPPVPCLYTAQAGLDIIKKIGISQIRQKSLNQTELIIKKAREREFSLFTPEENSLRGGAVSVGFTHAFPVKQALEKRDIKVDFRKGGDEEPDVIRIGPHFYTRDEEIETLFKEIDAILTSREYKKFPSEIKKTT
ncbi:MAG: aminotransferase class V-fold PLP-dependent enzyme [Candidatus Aminicenantes bacterium]|nr:aminotransferase class V-fold PLP-dependent enzyme [Candidatus Aminicenantes bacterium]MDH5715267.1 aminotransferase class V-fold PLP-dependent enzyme [Candidatus Aminicenantes bacterium]